MTGRKYIVDIRRHRGPDSSYLVELIGRYCSGSSGAVVEWLVRPDQAHLIPPDHIIGQADPQDYSWTTRIYEQLVQPSAIQNGGAGTPFWVLSYDNYLLMQVQKANSEKQPVTSVHLGELYKMNLIPRANSWGRWRPTPPSYWKSDQYSVGQQSQPRADIPGSSLTVEEGIALAKQVLRNGRHTSERNPLPQKELRPRMSAIDDRAVRQPGHPASENLIPDLVDRGLQEGWLKRFRGTPGKTGTELIYLTEEPVAQSGETCMPNPGPTQQVNSGREELATSPGDPPVATLSGDVRSLIEVPKAAPPPESVPDATMARFERPPKHQNRATDFESILSKSRIGAIPETRELLFDALENVASGLSGNPLLITELFSRAVKSAQEKGTERGYTSEKNWQTAERCIRRLMLWANVLIGDDGNPITDKIGSNSRRFFGLLPEFRRTCEAYLVEHIIEKMGDINYDDDPYYLGLTLYRRGKERAVSPEELKDKADAILVYLEQNGRIEMDANRTLRIKPGRKVTSPAA